MNRTLFHKKTFSTELATLFHGVLLLLFVTASMLVFSSSASAADIYATSGNIITHPDDVISLDIFVDPAGKSVNALAGKLIYPANKVHVQSISIKDSLAGVWLVSPDIGAAKEGVIEWSAVMPGGFLGVRSPFFDGYHAGKLFHVDFTVQALGEIVISFENMEMFANDGKATPVSVSSKSLMVQSLAGISETKMPEKKLPLNRDKDSVYLPLNISATITQSPLIENNAWFLSFGGNSGNSDSDYYEVAESNQADPASVSVGSWKKTQSPYILSDQLRQSYVHIRSIDGDGVRHAVTLRPVILSSAVSPWDILMISLFLLLLYLVLKWKKRFAL